MPAWRNPRWNSLRGPDADDLRGIFQDLEKFLKNPVFPNGINVGNGTQPTYNPSTDVVVQPPTRIIDLDTGTTPTDGVAPGQVTGLTLTAGIRSVLCRWTARTEPDMVNGYGTYIVDGSTDSTFVTGTRTQRVNGTMCSFSDLATGTPFYVRVRAVDADGNLGAYSVTVASAPVEATTSDLAVDSVTANQIAANAVTASELAAISIGVGKYIRSTSFTTGVNGWTIEASGSAEFNNIVARGDIYARRFIGLDGNFVTVPGGTFENGAPDLALWSFVACTSAIVGLPHGGVNAAQMTSTSAITEAQAFSQGITVDPGRFYKADGWFKQGASPPSAGSTRLELRFYDVSNTLLAINFMGSGKNPSAAWQSFNNKDRIRAQAPPTATYCQLVVAFAPTAVGQQLQIDDMTLQEAPSFTKGAFSTDDDAPRVSIRRSYQIEFDVDDAATQGSPVIVRSGIIAPGAANRQMFGTFSSGLWTGKTNSMVQVISESNDSTNKGKVLVQTPSGGSIDLNASIVKANGAAASVMDGVSSAFGNLAGTSLASSVPPPNQIYSQVGTVSGTTDVNGHLVVNLPTAFPNGLITVVVTNGDALAFLGWFATFTYTTSSFKIIALNNVTTAATFKAVRVNYIAYGW